MFGRVCDQPVVVWLVAVIMKQYESLKPQRRQAAARPAPQRRCHRRRPRRHPRRPRTLPLDHPVHRRRLLFVWQVLQCKSVGAAGACDALTVCRGGGTAGRRATATDDGR